MHTIYIDILITVNIFIDFILIICTAKFLHIKTKFIRIILGSIIGGILSLITLLPDMIFIINIAFNILGAAIIVLVSFGYSDFKTYIKRLTIYITISFLFCGIMIAVYSTFRPKGMAVYNNIVYFNISPVVLIILTLICYYILYFIKKIFNGSNGYGVCCVEVGVGTLRCSFNAKIDSGCNVKEPFSGYPVIIAEKVLLSDLDLSTVQMRAIPFVSLGGDGLIYGFKPESLIINSKAIDNCVYIGICENVIKSDIKALIPTELS